MAALGQVLDVKSTAEALQVLKEQQARDAKSMGVDLILKEHDPPHSNACRLLGRILEDDVLRTIPVVGARPHFSLFCFIFCKWHAVWSRLARDHSPGHGDTFCCGGSLSPSHSTFPMMPQKQGP